MGATIESHRLYAKENPLMKREQRKTERKKLSTFTPVYDSRQHALLGYLGDLTVQGARLVGDQFMETGHELTLMIDFPATAELPARRVILPARVIWCQQETNAKYFNTGFEFQQMDSPSKTVIEAVLERYQFRHPSQV
jgi:hypothetical protein